MSASAAVSAVATRKRSIDARRSARVKKFKRERAVIDYLNRGVSVREIAVKLGVTEKRMRAIVKEVLAAHIPGPPEEFIATQISRLNEALLVAYGAMSGMNLKAVDRVVRIVRELDCYQGYFPAERRSLPDARTPALTEAKAEEPLAVPADRSEMAMQAPEMARSTPGRATSPVCHPRRRLDANSPGAKSLSLAPLRPWTPACAGMTEDRNRPEMAPQAFENAQSAPGHAMAADGLDEAAAACHPRGRLDANSPGAKSLSLAPLRPWTPACAGMTEDRNRPEMAPQAPEKAPFAPGHGMAADGLDEVPAVCHPGGRSPSFASLRPWMPARAGMTKDRNRPEMAPQAPEKARFAPGHGMAADGLDEGAAVCHPGGSGDPEPPGATSPSLRPCAPGCPRARA